MIVVALIATMAQANGIKQCDCVEIRDRDTGAINTNVQKDFIRMKVTKEEVTFSVVNNKTFTFKYLDSKGIDKDGNHFAFYGNNSGSYMAVYKNGDAMSITDQKSWYFNKCTDYNNKK